MRVLLHTCCGPCASACAPRLREQGHEVALFFSNSNIDTAEEFGRREAAARKLAEAEGVEMATDEYRHGDWLEAVAKGFEAEPERGARCERCFRWSMERTAEFAAANGFDAFASSLTVSPHKPSGLVFAAGREAAAAAGGVVEFLEEDFKKRGGFLESTRRAKELGLYRQGYCGCEFGRAAAERKGEGK